MSSSGSRKTPQLSLYPQPELGSASGFLVTRSTKVDTSTDGAMLYYAQGTSRKSRNTALKQCSTKHASQFGRTLNVTKSPSFRNSKAMQKSALLCYYICPTHLQALHGIQSSVPSLMSSTAPPLRCTRSCQHPQTQTGDAARLTGGCMKLPERLQG